MDFFAVGSLTGDDCFDVWMNGGLRQWSSAGFGGLLLSWAAVTGLVVLPTAIVAGYQFRGSSGDSVEFELSARFTARLYRGARTIGAAYTVEAQTARS